MFLYQMAIPLLGLILGRELFTELRPRTLEVQVLEVIDGDTLVVGTRAHPWTIRLAGIDAPEKGQPTRLGQRDAGLIATKCLRYLVGTGPWLLEWRQRDIYGRILGDLSQRNRSLSLQLLERGCASTYPFLSDFSKKEQAEMLTIKNRAQRARRGLWSYGGFMRPYAWRRLQKTRRAPVATE